MKHGKKTASIIFSAGLVVGHSGAIGMGSPSAQTSDKYGLQPKALDWSGAVDRDNNGQNYQPYLSSRRLIEAWMPGSGSPWIPFFKLTVLASVEQMQEPETSQSGQAVSAARALFTPLAQRAVNPAGSFAKSAIPDNTALFIDLPGEQSIIWGITLATARGYQPVFTFNNWPHQAGVLPAHRLLGTAIYYAGTMDDLKNRGTVTTASRPVFLLDSDRLSFKARVNRGAYDNRYYVSPSDLPNALQLAAEGIKHVVYVTSFGAKKPDQIREQDDLNEYYSGLQAAGLDFAIVSAEAFDQVPAQIEAGNRLSSNYSSYTGPNPWLWGWPGGYSGTLYNYNGFYGAAPYNPTWRETWFHGGVATGPAAAFIRSASGGFGGIAGLTSGGSGG